MRDRRVNHGPRVAAVARVLNPDCVLQREELASAARFVAMLDAALDIDALRRALLGGEAGQETRAPACEGDTITEELVAALKRLLDANNSQVERLLPEEAAAARAALRKARGAP
jgi:hypothetical protein